VTGDSLRLASPQDGLNASFPNITGSSAGFNPRPLAGDTAVHSLVPWFRAFGIFPDSSKGDETWVWQRGMQPVGSSGATLTSVKTFAKLSDFTVVDPTGGSLSAALALPTQIASFAGDVRWSQFAALAASVAPGAILLLRLMTGAVHSGRPRRRPESLSKSRATCSGPGRAAQFAGAPAREITSKEVSPKRYRSRNRSVAR
jgi:hypothetical protein